MMTLGLTLQTKIIQLAPDATDIAMSIYSGIFNVGIGGGAFLGGLTVSQRNLNDIGWVGGWVALLAVCIVLLLFHRLQQIPALSSYMSEVTNNSKKDLKSE